jgi:N6-adenosine-specific RNA methylase IME4
LRTPFDGIVATANVAIRSHENKLGSTGNTGAHALVRYDAACRAIAEAKAVDEAKNIRDKAEAMRAYARQAKNKQLEVDAAEIRFRAERRLGQLMTAAKDAKQIAEGRPPKNGSGGDPFSRVTLAEAGIDKHLADRARKTAAVPDDEFEGIVGGWRDRVQKENERVVTNLLAAGQRAANKRTARAAVAPPQGKYGTIVIDPPWPMQKIEREVRPNQTGFDDPTMTEEDLVAFGATIGRCAAEHCHLFMWTTQKFLPMALRLLEAWGFRYVLAMVWHKTGGFQPVGLPQFNCEFVVYARSGSPEFVDTKAFNTCFTAERREHSRKPDAFYDLIRRVTAAGRIDIFSREAREGFDQYGNEIAKFAEAV